MLKPVFDEIVFHVIWSVFVRFCVARMYSHFHTPVRDGSKHLHIDVSTHWHVQRVPRNGVLEVRVKIEGHVHRIVTAADYCRVDWKYLVVVYVTCNERSVLFYDLGLYHAKTKHTKTNIWWVGVKLELVNVTRCIYGHKYWPWDVSFLCTSHSTCTVQL